MKKINLFICVFFLVIVSSFVAYTMLQAQNPLIFSNPSCVESIPIPILIRPYFETRKLFENRSPAEVSRNIANIKITTARDIEHSIRESEFLKENSRYKEAKEIAFKVLDKKPQYAAALYIIGKCYEDEGDLSKALEYYLKAEKINTTLPGLHFSIGVIYGNMKEQSSSKALKEYELEIQYNPQNWMPYINRAMLYGHAGDYENAFNDCAKAVELGQDNIRALLIAARFSEQLQVHPKEGKEFLRKALKIYPRSWRAWEIKGGFHYYDKEYKEAEKAYLRSLKLYNRTTTLYELCWTYVKMGRIQLARQIYDRANSMDPREDTCYKQEAKELLDENTIKK
jgi:tetratricopeptide (TPR) repeat protein